MNFKLDVASAPLLTPEQKCAECVLECEGAGPGVQHGVTRLLFENTVLSFNIIPAISF